MPPNPPPDHDDPVVNKSLSVSLFSWTLILMLTLVWALYDEVVTLRPWKGYQARFAGLYAAHLKQLKPKKAMQEKEIKESDEYQRLQQQVEEASQAAATQTSAIRNRIANGINPRTNTVRPAFQALRGEIGALTYQLEISTSESTKESLAADIEGGKQRQQELDLALDDGSGDTETVSWTYPQLEAEMSRLRELRVKLQSELVALGGPAGEAQRQLDAYLQNLMYGLTETQIQGLINKMEQFEVSIKQIHLSDIDWVDRCESCHAGTREPVELTKASMGGEAVFTSHPSRDLLKIHDPEEFGCTPCHNGNGRATSSVTKGHGRYKHWLWPLFEKENIEAGCQQCHSQEIVTPQAEVLNKGRELFLNKGCWGCHRFEGFDKEADLLSDVRNEIKFRDKEKAANEKQVRRNNELADDPDTSDEQASYYNARSQALQLANSQLDARLTTLKAERKSLTQEVRKFGPSLKEVRVKLRKEWIPVWLKNPHEFRPGTKMPVFRLEEDEIQAIAAYVWQNGVEGSLQKHPPGDAARGRELFETRGCLGCHSIGEGEQKMGGSFAANLSRVGEKTNYDFLVRWIHDPAEVTPEAGATGDEVHLIPVMPNLRLTFADARDIASYLLAQKTDATYAAADYMDDPERAEEGLALARRYGCAGCHEISGLETEGRIGTELTLEGSKPIERLDFALFTHPAKVEGWYSHKGFFEQKLQDPAFFDQGKVREPGERLRMPNFNLTDDEITALTTFLLGAVDTALPANYRFEPEDERADIQRGWWMVRRYNCTGCHQIRPGDETSFMGMERYQDPDWVEQMPPQLYSEGARVRPDWLISFLSNPALSETDIHRNGIREYLHARMPTFQFTERQVRTLMRFFMARSSQPHPYIDDQLAPLSAAERTLARRLFTSRGAPCLKCHMTGDPGHDRNATAPNFLVAAERLKPDWTRRWMLEPAGIAPGTAMPSELFRHEQGRWIFDGPLPAIFEGYEGDHADLLVRYMFQFTPAELRRLRSSSVQ